MQRLGILLALFAAIGISPPAAAYPDRPIRLVVGWPAGGPIDTPARFLAEKLKDAFKQPVVIENKTGASGVIAAKDVISQKSDGHTLLLCTHYEPGLNLILYRTPPYRFDDLVPIALIGRYHLLLTVPSASPFQTIEDLISYAKAKPGALTYGTAGQASVQEFVFRQLSKNLNLDMTAVPFRGAPPAMTELIAGRIDTFLSPAATALPMMQSQKARALATTSPERLAAAPDVPTLKERQIPVMGWFGWLGVCAASGTPRSIVDQIYAAVAPIVSSAEYKTMMERLGSVAALGDAADLKRIIDQQLGDVGPIIKEFNIYVE
jgi:tripartite-type tricarboxylate transporter receptor subunit TctC